MVAGYDQAGVASHSDAANGHAHLGYKLAAAGVGGQVPHPDVALLVTCPSTSVIQVPFQPGLLKTLAELDQLMMPSRQQLLCSPTEST